MTLRYNNPTPLDGVTDAWFFTNRGNRTEREALKIFRTGPNWPKTSTLALIVALVIFANWSVGVAGYFGFNYISAEIKALKEARSPNLPGDSRYWADEIIAGERAFILYFRHTEREKWPLALTYDFFEVEAQLEGRDQTYSPAVCLSDRGIEDARIIGETFRFLDIPVKNVISSPSCRAREMAAFAFGGADEIDHGLLHSSVVPDWQREEFANRLRTALERNAPSPGSYVVVTAHGNTLSPYSSTIFPNFEGALPEPEESGFYLLELVDGDLVPRWVFQDFLEFGRQVLSF
jgi:broad specificity phosphatase PhoE